ncbi:dihydrofolate reductase family protein [uncultured Leifsonia sp.]|jgi:5-amino-6-(5-phosphoribosylamino)uracil reductase|uniref:RibD family protein n=1 Tax=uncultured Leifsonia sp. TaxID=340359 RepID=UPI0025D96AC8|nr:dihydrofolate reductase family protein [uncultured Leifsonia sp.]
MSAPIPATVGPVARAAFAEETAVMSDLPYVTLSCCVSLDGYLDTARPPKLALSNAADFDRVDEVRAQNDVILVGARTVRRDDPRLLVRSSERQDRREAEGRCRTPWKATVTLSGDLDPAARFFTLGDTTKLVYCPRGVADALRRRLGTLATVVALGDEPTMPAVLADLGERGVRRLMVEGGGTTLTEFLAADLVDELHLAVAPFFVGDPDAPRFVRDADFPWTSDHRARLVEARPIGDVVLLRYARSERVDVWPPGAGRT